MKIFSKTTILKIGTNKNVHWHIQASGKWWNEVENRWTDYNPDVDLSSTNKSFSGKMSPRKVARLVRRWNLPSGTVMRFLGVYCWRGRNAVVPAEVFEVAIK